jgi:hypothetical protein
MSSMTLRDAGELSASTPVRAGARLRAIRVESPMGLRSLRPRSSSRATDAPTRALVIHTVEFLRARKGVASSAAFTAELGEFTSRFYGSSRSCKRSSTSTDIRC